MHPRDEPGLVINGITVPKYVLGRYRTLESELRRNKYDLSREQQQEYLDSYYPEGRP